MVPPELKSLIEKLDEMVGDSSMPDIVASLIHLSRHYRDEMKKEGNSEYQGWIPWEEALSDALVKAAGKDEFDELVGVES